MAALAQALRTPGEMRTLAGTEGEGSIALLDADPDFGAVIAPAERGLAAGVRLPLVELRAGDWRGPQDDRQACGPLVLRGLVVRTLHRYGRATAELYGPGDLVAGAGSEGGTATWRVLQPATLVALDERFEIAARRWPGLWRVTLERWSQRCARLAAHLAALQLSRVDERVEAVLWQLAERFGKVTTDGVVLPVALTHQMLGELTAAKRPTVSVALGELAAQQRVVRLAAGGWLLRRPGLGEAGFETERRLSPR